MLLDTPEVAMGSPAPDFTLQTPEGEVHSRDSLMGERGLLVAFICNHCPYVVGVIDRLAKDLRRLEAAGVGTVCIMSNDWEKYPADSPDRMTAFAAAHELTGPYLVDTDQSVARAYCAVCTPDFFGYDAQGKLRYRGRLDDKGRANPAGRTTELVDAMLQIAETGEGPEVQHPSMGCSIKWR